MRFYFFLNSVRLLLAFLSCVHTNWGQCAGKQEYSARTLGATWGIISAIMVPIVIVLICIGWRILVRRKRDEKDENEFLTIKSRPIDPDESMKINSDDDSIPYKKDTEDSPEPTEPVRVVSQAYPDLGRTDQSYPSSAYPGAAYPGAAYPGAAYPGPVRPGQAYPGSVRPDQPYNESAQPFTYGQPLPPPLPETAEQARARQWAGETEIN